MPLPALLLVLLTLAAQPVLAIGETTWPVLAVAAATIEDAPCHEGAMPVSSDRQTAHPDAGKAASPPAGHDCCDQDGRAPCPPGHGCGCAGLASLTPPLSTVIVLTPQRTETAHLKLASPPPRHTVPPLRPPIG